MRKILPVFFLVIFLFLLKLSPVSALIEIEETCKVIPEKEKNSRPTACYICNQNELLTPSCANSFKITAGVDYNLWEGPDFEENWDGTIEIKPADSEDLKIPFVGMEKQESENEYLADYFEGTNEYYRNYGNQNLITNYQGVLRKLTPYGYQNQLKKELIARAPLNEAVGIENPIHNYWVKYQGRVCWDTPFWLDAGRSIFNSLTNLAFNAPLNAFLDLTINQILKKSDELSIDLKIPDIGHYCLYEYEAEGVLGWIQEKIAKLVSLFVDTEGFNRFNQFLSTVTGIPGLIHINFSPGEEAFLSDFLIQDGEIPRMPPDSSEENYIEKLLAWKNLEGGKWYRLWQAVPMLSREDSQGEILPYLAGADEKNFLELTTQEATVSSVPHLARLYEGSKIISDILIPVNKEGKIMEMVKTEEIPQADPPNACFKEKYTPPTGEGDSLCCEPYQATLKAVEEFTDPGYFSHNCGTPQADPECAGRYTQTAYRDLGVNLKHPYLDEIWSFTTNAKGGFFNIFRPQNVPAFEDIDASQAISYSFSNGEIAPERGLFFFPHLGGIQTAKEWVVNQALWPYSSQD